MSAPVLVFTKTEPPSSRPKSRVLTEAIAKLRWLHRHDPDGFYCALPYIDSSVHVFVRCADERTRDGRATPEDAAALAALRIHKLRTPPRSSAEYAALDGRQYMGEDWEDEP